MRFKSEVHFTIARVRECPNIGDYRDINLERALTGSIKITSRSRGDHRVSPDASLAGSDRLKETIVVLLHRTVKRRSCDLRAKPPTGFSSYLHNLFCLLFATIGFTSWNKSRDIEHLSSPFRYTTLAGCNQVCVYGLIPRRGLMR